MIKTKKMQQAIPQEQFERIITLLITYKQQNPTKDVFSSLRPFKVGSITSFIFVINLFDLGGSDNLVKNDYKVENLIDFPGH